MIWFSKPCDQDRFNATLYELLHMKFSGTVAMRGDWDAYDALDYLERRLKIRVLPTLRDDGSVCYFNDKYVIFMDDRVMVTNVHHEITKLQA